MPGEVHIKPKSGEGLGSTVAILHGGKDAGTLTFKVVCGKAGWQVTRGVPGFNWEVYVDAKKLARKKYPNGC